MAENKEKTSKNKSEAVDLSRLVFDMLGELSERSRNIIVKRFSLDNKNAKTLDEIGKDYGITRERVRQIETEAIIKLKSIGKKYDLDEVFGRIKETIENHGGIMSEEKIIETFFNDKSFEADKQAVLLILSLDDKIKTLKETSTYKKIYFYKEESVLRFEKVIGKIKDYLQKKNREISFDEMAEIVNEAADRDDSLFFSAKVIKSYLEANKIVLKNILGKWGCEKWPHINPKNMRDKSYLALKKNEKPLHFTEIAKEINTIWSKRKNTNSQTVHNELIKDNRFVLVGRGIYALKEWGYEKGTVLSVIIKIMLKKNREMKQEEIVKEVLRERQVKENTIILNLQNKKWFEKMSGKVYKLK